MSNKHYSITVLPPNRRLAEIMVVVDVYQYDMIEFESVLNKAIEEGIKSFDALSDINFVVVRFQNFRDDVTKLARLSVLMMELIKTLPGDYRLQFDPKCEFLDVVHDVVMIGYKEMTNGK